ncbi:hypothetical protein C8Q70DRAFT_1054668 [Cubamyces menziesii]|nr:hypothetical protein C8Q70DRAFT_1054668 [Cubamyces menziesii]
MPILDVTWQITRTHLYIVLRAVSIHAILLPRFSFPHTARRSADPLEYIHSYNALRAGAVSQTNQREEDGLGGSVPRCLGLSVQLVAPTLRTLCNIQGGLFVLPFEFPCVFPQPRDLVLAGKISAFEAENLRNAGREPKMLPALERIYCIPSRPDDTMPALSSFPIPSLTHLRLSSMDADGVNGTDISPMVFDLLNYPLVDPYLVVRPQNALLRQEHAGV